MKLDDESLLSAFLDNELDPARRLSIESALLTDPQLAERLQQLASIRSTLRRLPRPLVGWDVSGSVQTRIEARPSVRIRKALRSPSNRRRLTLAGASLGAAAAILLFAQLQPPGPLPRPGASEVTKPGRSTDHTAVAPSNEHPPPDQGGPGETEIAEVGISTPVLEPSSAELSAELVDNTEDRDVIRGYLDRDEVQRLMLVVDTITHRSVEMVRGAIQETGRANSILGELRIAQGVEIDPERPHEAVVFLVVLDDLELQHLGENLRHHAFRPELDDRSLATSVVSQLADLSTIHLSPGISAPALRPVPPDGLGPIHMATKSSGELGPPDTPRPPNDDGPMPRDDSTLDDAELRPSPSVPRPGSTAKVYLVWVTTPGPKSDPMPM